MVGPKRRAHRCGNCGTVSPGSATRCECGLVFGSRAFDLAAAATRNRRFFDLRQQASGMFIGLFIGGVIAPVLMLVDSEKGLYRGLFLIVMSAILFAVGLAAWFRLPKDQRTWKSLRSKP